jgi:hypothetical protein
MPDQDELARRESHLIAIVEKELPEFDACATTPAMSLF